MNKSLFLVVLAAALAGCSGGGESNTQTHIGADGSKVTSSDKGVTVQTADGKTASVGAANVSEAELGYPFYPGSTPVEHADMKMEADGMKTFMSIRETKDGIDKVLEFYKGKIDKPDSSAIAGEMAMITKNSKDGMKLAMSAMPHEGVTRISFTVSTPMKK